MSSINHVEGHAAGCVCDDCLNRQAALDRMIHRTEQRATAREDAKREASVPLEVRRRDAAEAEAAVATIEAEDIGRIRTKLQEGVQFATERAERVAALYRSRRSFSKDDASAFFGATQRAAELYERDQRLAKMQKAAEKRATQARVVAEVDPYSKGSPHSWISDVLAARAGMDAASDTPIRGDGGHGERLQRHGAVVVRALERRTKYGKMIERQWADSVRQVNVDQNRRAAERTVREYRTGVTTGGGATASASGAGAAAFVTPLILMDVWATYRSPTASFINACEQVDLPPYGMQAYIPIVTTGTTVATDTEGAATSEGDPVTAFASGAIVSKAGQVTVSQATRDRVGPGITGDVLICRQLKEQLQAQVDVYGLTLVIASAATVAGITTFTLASATAGVGGLLGDLKKAKSKLTDTAGVRLRGTHCFALDDFVDYIEAYSDGNARPVFSPDPGTPADQSSGFSGYTVSGLGLYGDTNIPNSGSNLQLVVCRADTIVHLQSVAVCDVLPQFGAGNLDPLVRVRQYCTTIPRYPSGVAVVTGTGYAATTFA